MSAPKLTARMRREVANEGPYRYESRTIDTGQKHMVRNGRDCIFVKTYTEDDGRLLVAVLNAIASEPEAVVRAREQLLMAARRNWHIEALDVCAKRYRDAVQAAKMARKP